MNTDTNSLQTTNEALKDLFTERFSSANVVGGKADMLFAEIDRRIGSIDSNMEGFLDSENQRDLSLKFHWGHNHDFGNGASYQGLMGDRHLDIISKFVSSYQLPVDLSGKNVLDIGVWTGGTSLLLAAMGANVTALEEVKKYAEMVNILASTFGLNSQVKCLPMGLYDALPMFADSFDYVIYSGVLYHVSDPLLSLRLIFTALKDGGICFVETLGYPSPDSVCHYEGPAITHNDGSSRQSLNRGGWNYFMPSPSCLRSWCSDVGFQEVEVGDPDPALRILASAKRTDFTDFCRAGFSLPRCR